MVHNKIAQETLKTKGYSKSEMFRMFGVSSSGYYNWVKRYEDKDGKRKEAEQNEQQIMERFRKIIKKIGFIPGKRTFRAHMFRDYGIQISVKRCSSLMKKMNLVANRPKKDAYKGQATHFHECAAFQNHIQQDFKIGPRQIILTDITYLYYGQNRTVCYLCCFKDAFTNEILGHATSSKMNVGLVKTAYNQMMELHGQEFKKDQYQVFIHSDQGSQYLSTEFKEILEDEGFIQSMSARGNSQDNAPMESFFGRMKTRIIDLIALCPNLETVKKMIDGYMHSYNTEQYQYPLAGLTPREYYLYVMSGIYPLDSYYGVKATELMSIEELVDKRMKKAKERQDRIKENNRKKREEKAKLNDPYAILARDRKLISKQIDEWTKNHDMANKQIKALKDILEEIKKAASFVLAGGKQLVEELRNPQAWKKYSELNYVNKLEALY